MKFRLSAGNPASRLRGGVFAPEEIKPRKYWAPNTEPPLLLTCGCAIPWPILKIKDGGPVWCDQHGWREIRKEEKPCPSNPSQAILDQPPF